MRGSAVILGADADVLRCYCEAVSRYAQAAELYAASSPLMRRDGELVKNPLHQVVRDNADAVRQFARELGLAAPMAAATRAVNDRLAREADQPTIDLRTPIGPEPGPAGVPRR